MKAQDILNAALKVPEAELQLYCDHDKVVVVKDGTEEYADCAVCGKDISDDYDWFKHATEKYENQLLAKGFNL